MKTILISAGLKLIFTAIRAVITPKLFEHIKALVSKIADLNVPGTEKKAYVLQQLNDITGELKASVKTLPNLLLSMAIDIAWAEVAKEKGNIIIAGNKI